MAPANVAGALQEPVATTVATSAEATGGNSLPNNPGAVLPSVVGYTLIRNVAIVFGVVLVAALLVLRWRRGEEES